MIIGYGVDLNPTVEANAITPTIEFTCTQCAHHFRAAVGECTVENSYPDVMGYIMETYSCVCPHCHKTAGTATMIF